MQHISELTQTIRPGKNGWAASPVERVRQAQRVTLDQLDENHHPLVKKAMAAARGWASRKIGGVENASLILVATQVYGKDGKPDPGRTGYGCGKTHIAQAVQWSSYTMLEDGTPVAPAGKFFAAADLLELLGEGNTMRELVPPGVDTVNGRIGGVPVLVIDDVGSEGTLHYVAKEAQADEKRARYFRIIDYCYQHKISVVITANLSLTELAGHVGGRAWSRLLEMAPAGSMVDMTGVPDYRRKTGGR